MTETFSIIELEDGTYLYREEDNTAISFYTISMLMDLYNADPEELDRIIEHVEEVVAAYRQRAEA